MKIRKMLVSALPGLCVAWSAAFAAGDFPKPYAAPCTERENVFAFAEKPAIRLVEKDRYEITFAVTGFCDVAAAIVDADGSAVRHLGAGVLGGNAPAPFQKNSKTQKIYWNGKDDLDVYHKEPEKLKLRVMLGMKPVFDKRLRGTSGKSMPGYVAGIAVGPDGAYVFAQGTTAKSHGAVRKFDRDGNYLTSLAPPPADMPLGKLSGLGYVEYEKGKKAIHGPHVYDSMNRGLFLPGLSGAMINDLQPALAGSRILWVDNGREAANPRKPEPCRLHYIHTDGSTDIRGMEGIPFSYSSQRQPRLTTSPDGRYVYMTDGDPKRGWPGIYRLELGGDGLAQPFAGKYQKLKGDMYRFEPGSDNDSLSGVTGLDCDAAGRLYAVDQRNNRLQVFSPEGKYLKSIRIDRPRLVRLHQKTGAIYVLHEGRDRGKSVWRMTKLVSFDDPKEDFHADDFPGTVMAIDSWGPKPRIWAAGLRTGGSVEGAVAEGPGVRIFEEQGKTVVKIVDFDEDARKEAGEGWAGHWEGNGIVKGALICDPVREHVYHREDAGPLDSDPMKVIDIKTGKFLWSYQGAYGGHDDGSFDKRGYLHLHLVPFYSQARGGVARVDPGQAVVKKDPKTGGNLAYYPECPYDYGSGEEKFGWRDESCKMFTPWSGILHTKDQGGGKTFQDGFGVNMMGEVASESNIYYVPKMEDIGRQLSDMGPAAHRVDTGCSSDACSSYAEFMKGVEAMSKRGQKVYFIKRRPGIPLAGGTIWTYDRNGEMKQDCAVTAGELINGTQIDEDGGIYFVNARIRRFGDKAFLQGKGGILGHSKTDFRMSNHPNYNPFSGTLIKAAPGARCSVITANAPVPLTELPKRPPELMSTDYTHTLTPKTGPSWVEGAEWLYAGASPLVAVGCTCPSQRLHLDWYKRSYVPEAYRHSFGVLDAAGNLIMHLGRYGNFDDAPGGRDGAKPGGTDIALFNPRYVSGTDEHIVFEDWAEKLVVLRIEYHAREDAAIAIQ